MQSSKVEKLLIINYKEWVQILKNFKKNLQNSTKKVQKTFIFLEFSTLMWLYFIMTHNAHASLFWIFLIESN